MCCVPDQIAEDVKQESPITSHNRQLRLSEDGSLLQTEFFFCCKNNYQHLYGRSCIWIKGMQLYHYFASRFLIIVLHYHCSHKMVQK